MESQGGDVERAVAELREAEMHLARASTLLGRGDRKDWWYACNKLYHGAFNLAKTIDER